MRAVRSKGRTEGSKTSVGQRPGNGRAPTFLFHRELGRGQLFLLDKAGFLRGRGLHFTLCLKLRAMLRGVRVIHRESPGPGWGRGCGIAHWRQAGRWSEPRIPPWAPAPASLSISYLPEGTLAPAPSALKPWRLE